MKAQLLTLSVFFILLLSATACKQKPLNIERGFYYWKTSGYSISYNEIDLLHQLNVKKLYIKFFEVDTDPVLGAVPVSKTSIRFYSPLPQNTAIIPVVFIRNKVLLQATQAGLDSLADNIVFLIRKKFQSNFTGQSFGEIQIDCDWTGKTRDNYFYLLKKIKEISGKSLSCTLRLYPYKYRDKMGIPPADRAVLMCYNLKSPLDHPDDNSILTANELEKYLVNTKKYPIDLDFALPVFSWMLVYQNNQFAGLLNTAHLQQNNFLKKLNPLWYEVTNDTETDNLYLKTGDKIKLEEVSAETIRHSIGLLRKYAATGNHTLILFHLDDTHLRNYDHETLHSFFSFSD